MSAKPIIWIASYPRSGNTLVRTIIFHCFGVRTASVYPRDLGGGGVADFVGHIEHSGVRTIDFGEEPLHLIKTHRWPSDARPAIYIVRDGREATTSLYDFGSRKRSIVDVIEGRNGFGTWADHLTKWDPLNRPDTLLLKYEQILGDLQGTVEKLALHLQLAPRSYEIPPREHLATSDGKWVRSASVGRTALIGQDLERFWEVNGAVMDRYGYTR